jgi:hypothetical protein
MPTTVYCRGYTNFLKIYMSPQNTCANKVMRMKFVTEKTKILDATAQIL